MGRHAYLRDGGQDPAMNGGAHTPVGRTEEVTGFANYTGAWTCKSRSGRWRPAHEYLGGVCLYCDQVEPEQGA